MKKPLKRAALSARWNEFHIADQFLLIIMIILMLQTAHNLFFHEMMMQDSTTLDVVIRTTTAAIFGYFISANFHSKKVSASSSQRNTNAVEIEASSENGFVPKARIGFNTDAEEKELQSGSAHSVTNSTSEPDNKKQIIIIAMIGIVCLLFLLIARNYATMNTASVATLSQLRDFISGSVGFLIGQSTQHKK